MIYLQFLIGAIMYGVIASASYSTTLKASKWYYLVGLLAAVAANFIWLWISRTESNSSSLVIKGLYWDSMLTLIYLAIPLLFFQASLSYTQGIGIALVFIGLILTKI